jgi:phosphatidylethanolamine/phosphatidyl-N-methylethanolamine N-methyltransferase
MSSSTSALNSLAVFGSELLANAGSIGAALPSSPMLARRIAAQLPRHPAGYVVELGAGTGAVTEALLEHGLPADRLLPVEISENMVRHLRQRFPGLHVLGGDAAKLGALLARHAPAACGHVSHVVSSLPLRSLPLPLVARIIREVRRLLAPDGTFIQYTYNLACDRYRPLDGFQRRATSIVWMNLPPARVDVFQPLVSR